MRYRCVQILINNRIGQLITGLSSPSICLQRCISSGVLLEEIMMTSLPRLHFVLTRHQPCSLLSVASSRERQKTNTMQRITRQRSMFSPLTKTNSLLRPDLYSVNRGKNKLPAWSVIPGVTNELAFWPNELI